MKNRLLGYVRSILDTVVYHTKILIISSFVALVICVFVLAVVWFSEIAQPEETLTWWTVLAWILVTIFLDLKFQWSQKFQKNPSAGLPRFDGGIKEKPPVPEITVFEEEDHH